jgi:hypothetical protein
MRRHRGAHPLALLVAVARLLCIGTASAEDDTATLFASAAAALKDGRPQDAVASLEALADRGVIDPVASYDRGLAYAMRARMGAEAPGDLGRAAQGFEEARGLSRDPQLVEGASRGLSVIRSEVARRRVRAGEPVEVDPGRSLARTVAGLLSEDTWSVIAVLASVILAVCLFMRALARAGRVRISGGVGAGIATPVLTLAVVMTLAARHDRMHLREAVVVVANARPIDERGITVPGATTLPEGARVELVEASGAWSRVRFGSIEARVASSALRALARPE